nr:DUF305 domain-containing protein [Aurantimonas endophytica]
MTTHSFSPEHPHGPRADGGIGAPPEGPPGVRGAVHSGPTAPAASASRDVSAAYEETMAKMHPPMTEGMAHPDPDVAFVLGMIPHHQGAIDMAGVQLRYGTDPANRQLAAEIIEHQKMEIARMRAWPMQHGVAAPE